jgi:hypothetical protein
LGSDADTIYSINVAANGDILLAGAMADAGQDLRAVVVRLDSGGDLVSAFGSGGVLAFQVDSENTGIRAAVLREDRLYITGEPLGDQAMVAFQGHRIVMATEVDEATVQADITLAGGLVSPQDWDLGVGRACGHQSSPEAGCVVLHAPNLGLRPRCMASRSPQLTESA